MRCRDRALHAAGDDAAMTDPDHVPGRALDRCICVHAEQNALLAAARFGMRAEGSVLYATLSPCFGCLKEAIQVGVRRVVYELEYPVARPGRSPTSTPSSPRTCAATTPTASARSTPPPPRP